MNRGARSGHSLPHNNFSNQICSKINSYQFLKLPIFFLKFKNQWFGKFHLIHRFVGHYLQLLRLGPRSAFLPLQGTVAVSVIITSECSEIQVRSTQMAAQHHSMAKKAAFLYEAAILNLQRLKNTVAYVLWNRALEGKTNEYRIWKELCLSHEIQSDLCCILWWLKRCPW